VEVRVLAGNPVLSWSVKSRKVLGRELRGQLSAELAQARLDAGAEPLAGLPSDGLTGYLR
jgi:hypothetical protein